MSRPITLPRWLMSTTTMQMSSVDLVVVFALSLSIHGTADAARQMRDKVCMEHQPKLNLLARIEDDAKVMQAVVNIVQRATDQLGILPGVTFPVNGGGV